MEKVKLLTLDNFDSGEIIGEFEDIDIKITDYEKQFLKNNDMLIKKNGANIQIAIIKLDDSGKILPYGNIFVVRFDESKLNPYYVKNYLELNEIGIRQFENAKSDEGVITLRNLNKGKFYKIIIPKLDIEKQNEIEKNILKIAKLFWKNKKKWKSYIIVISKNSIII